MEAKIIVHLKETEKDFSIVFLKDILLQSAGIRGEMIMVNLE